jgi:hypothetical protein
MMKPLRTAETPVIFKLVCGLSFAQAAASVRLANTTNFQLLRTQSHVFLQ